MHLANKHPKNIEKQNKTKLMLDNWIQKRAEQSAVANDHKTDSM